MSKPGLSQITTAQTFEVWFNKTNEIVSIINSDAMTASALGDTTIGNATLVGSFTANNIIAENTFQTNSIAPKVGSSIVTINGQLTANNVAQTAAVFRSTQGARTTYTSGSTNWNIGFENTTTNSFIIDNGVGGTKFRLTSDGNLFLSGEISATLNGNANTASTWATPRTFTIGNTGKDVDGSSNVSWSLGEIGAVSPSISIDTGTGLTGGGNLSTNRTISLSSASLESLSRADTAVQPSRTVNTGTGLTGGGDLSVNRTLSLTGQALALHNLGSNGIIVRNGASSVITRAIVAGSNIIVSNGDGVAGNPVITAVVPAPTAAQVGAATAGLGAGAVGTYAFLWHAANSGVRAPGTTVAGSSLRYANDGGNGAEAGNSTTAPAGTWRLMGVNGWRNASAGGLGGPHQTSVWLRIA